MFTMEVKVNWVENANTSHTRTGSVEGSERRVVSGRGECGSRECGRVSEGESEECGSVRLF